MNPPRRATHTIQHRRDHRLLHRVDGAGPVRAGEYTLARRAVAIVDFFVEEETLTRESLVVLTRALTSKLGAVVVDGDGAILLASSKSSHKREHRIARIDVLGPVPAVDGIASGHRALVLAPLVDGAGYTLLLRQSASSRAARRRAVAARQAASQR